MAEQIFRYDQLERPWQIRLVELSAGREDDEICCRTRLIPGGDAKDLDPLYDPAEDATKIPYSAISYTWGPPDETHVLRLDGQPFRVGTNLFAFLKQARSPERSFFYWIDAISINQEDVAERSNQVKRITSIYRSAKEVIVWLGPEAANSSGALKKMDYLARRVQREKKPDEVELAVLQRWFYDPSWRPYEPNEAPDDGPWIAIRMLLERAWWTRAWVIQETTVPEQLTWVMCGDYGISWTNLHVAMTVIMSMGLKPEFEILSSIPVVKASRFLGFQLKRHIGGEQLQLLSLLHDFRDFEATDNRDKVYALLGMSNEVGDAKFPQPNYEKSIKEVYRDVAQYYIITSTYGHMLDILGYCNGSTSETLKSEGEKLSSILEQIAAAFNRRDEDDAEPLDDIEALSSRGDNEDDKAVSASTEETTSTIPENLDDNSSNGWPSWVPDWRRPLSARPLFKKLQAEPGLFGGHSSWRPAYSASGDNPDSMKIHYGIPQTIRFDGDHMLLPGLKIDTLEELHDVGEALPYFNKFDLSELRKLEPSNIGSTYVTGESVHDAYSRTVTGDIMIDNNAPIARGNSLMQLERPSRNRELIRDNDQSSTIIAACSGRQLSITERKLIGLVPELSEVGDKIFVLYGGQVPFILRPKGEFYELIGECYIHGIMDGEALARMGTGTAQLEKVRIR
jgi:hypothetical protein